eukprot:705435-Amphidinium_carterae.1
MKVKPYKLDSARAQTSDIKTSSGRSEVEQRGLTEAKVGCFAEKELIAESDCQVWISGVCCHGTRVGGAFMCCMESIRSNATACHLSHRTGRVLVNTTCTTVPQGEQRLRLQQCNRTVLPEATYNEGRVLRESSEMQIGREARDRVVVKLESMMRVAVLVRGLLQQHSDKPWLEPWMVIGLQRRAARIADDEYVGKRSVSLHSTAANFKF